MSVERPELARACTGDRVLSPGSLPRLRPTTAPRRRLLRLCLRLWSTTPGSSPTPTAPQTGEPIGTDTLRTRLGVPAPHGRRHRRPTRLIRKDNAHACPCFFHSVERIGPVQVGTARDAALASTGHSAVCTAERCGWSADYGTRTAAQLAARTHRCRIPTH